jgi:hypothetical protein
MCRDGGLPMVVCAVVGKYYLMEYNITLLHLSITINVSY